MNRYDLYNSLLPYWRMNSSYMEQVLWFLLLYITAPSYTCMMEASMQILLALFKPINLAGPPAKSAEGTPTQ